MLVSDPQTPVRNPSLFYEFHVQGKAFNARGIGVPGSPIILIGFTDQVAWGVTALGADQADLFQLELDPDKPDQYRFDGQWQPLTVQRETIGVKGGEPIEYAVRETHLGPVATAFCFAQPGEAEVALKRIPVCETDRETIQGASRPNWSPQGDFLTVEYESPVQPPDLYRVDVSTGRIRVNDAPTLAVTQPDGTGDSVTQGSNYTVYYDLADTDSAVTVDLYYDADGSGLDGTAISGCSDLAEGTNQTCSWNTTGVPLGTYYIYGRGVSDGVNTEVTDYSPGEVTVQAVVSGTVYTDEAKTSRLLTVELSIFLSIPPIIARLPLLAGTTLLAYRHWRLVSATYNANDINPAYQKNFGRDARPDEVAYWSRNDVRNKFAQTCEGLTNALIHDDCVNGGRIRAQYLLRQQLSKYFSTPEGGPELKATSDRSYKAAFNRLPNPEELAYWQTELRKPREKAEDMGYEYLIIAHKKWMQTSVKPQERTALIQAAYAEVYGRPPSKKEADFWMADMPKKGILYAELCNYLKDWISGNSKEQIRASGRSDPARVCQGIGLQRAQSRGDETGDELCYVEKAFVQ